jgi:hypothetical protein
MIVFLRRRSVQLRLFAALVLTVRAAVGGLSNLLWVFGSVAFMILAITLYVDMWTTRRHAGGTVFWRGHMLFDPYRLSQVFPAVQIGRGSPAMLTAGKAGGRFEVRADGLHWRGRCGSQSESGSGEFTIAWNQLGAATVMNAPGKIRWLGGLLEMEIVGGSVPLTGEFLGSQSALRAAISTASHRSGPVTAS